MDTNESIKSILIENFTNLQRDTMFLLKAIPQDKLEYSPCKQMKKLGKLARHISLIPFIATLSAEEYFCEHPTSTQINDIIDETFGTELINEDYVTIFERSCEYFLGFYNNKCDEALVHQFFINHSNNEATPFLKSFLNVQSHLAQHTGALNTYIRQLLVPDAVKEYIEKKVLYNL